MDAGVFPQAPNPYTYFDVPNNPFDVALGLPKNDNGDKPDVVKPKTPPSYCAYRYSGTGYPSKVFFDATTNRLFSVSSGVNQATGEKEIIKILTMTDSLAMYRINDANKTIIKTPLSAMQELGRMDVVSRKDEVTEVDVVSYSGRWCYKETVVTTTVSESLFGPTTDVNHRTQYIDMETGIVLNDEAGNIPTRLRNIHLGNPYPELFELPEGYTLIVQDFSAQIKAQQEMEEMMKKRYEQLENMGKSGAQGDMRNKIDEGAAALEQLLNKMK